MDKEKQKKYDTLLFKTYPTPDPNFVYIMKIVQWKNSGIISIVVGDTAVKPGNPNELHFRRNHYMYVDVKLLETFVNVVPKFADDIRKFVKEHPDFNV